jgi:hypothetical protein
MKSGGRNKRNSLSSGKEKTANPRTNVGLIPEGTMGVSDFVLLAKKIAVGILVTVIPLGILTGGLLVSQNALKKATSKKNAQSGAKHSVEVSHAN